MSNEFDIAAEFDVYAHMGMVYMERLKRKSAKEENKVKGDRESILRAKMSLGTGFSRESTDHITTHTYTHAIAKAQSLQPLAKSLCITPGSEDAGFKLMDLCENLINAAAEAKEQFHLSTDEETNYLCRTLEGKNEFGDIIQIEEDPNEETAYYYRLMYPNIRKEHIDKIAESSLSTPKRHELLRILHNENSPEEELIVRSK